MTIARCPCKLASPTGTASARVFARLLHARWSPHLRCLPQRCGDGFLPDKFAPVVVSRRLPALLFVGA